MKAYTDVEQSKRLAEILPINTADCCYIMYCTSDNIELRYEGQPPMFLGDIPITEIEVEHIPCWSLAALLDVIPQEIFDGEYIINITEGCDNKWVLTYDHHENINHSYYGLSSDADNLVDVCVEMILKLHERGLL